MIFMSICKSGFRFQLRLLKKFGAAASCVLNIDVDDGLDMNENKVKEESSAKKVPKLVIFDSEFNYFSFSGSNARDLEIEVSSINGKCVVESNDY